jgi:hypothetical protein
MTILLAAGMALLAGEALPADPPSPPRDVPRESAPAPARPAESPVERNDASSGGPAREGGSSERSASDAVRPRQQDDLRRVRPNRGERQRPFHDDGRWESQPRLER